MPGIKGKKNNKIKPYDFNINSWCNHIAHQSCGMAFQKECRICNLKVAEYQHVVYNVEHDVTFFNTAIISKRKSIGFDEYTEITEKVLELKEPKLANRKRTLKAIAGAT